MADQILAELFVKFNIKIYESIFYLCMLCFSKSQIAVGIICTKPRYVF